MGLLVAGRAGGLRDMAAKKKPRSNRWEKDPSAIYRVMSMQQAFTTEEQTKLNLPVREALQSFRDGTATDMHWNTLAAITNVCLLRGERIAPEVVEAAKDGKEAVLRILGRYQRTGKWGLSHGDLVALETCIDLHEQLIELSTPAQMMQDFRETIVRMNTGHVNRVRTKEN